MIAFTICSNNYLNKAQVLVHSIKRFEDVTVYLFLADQRSDLIDYKRLGFDKVITPEELEITNLQWQLENYNIIEFNTAIKGPAFKYLLEKTNANFLYYFDPDIKVYKTLSSFSPFWEDAAILLTPHILTPVPYDGMFPEENLFLNHGTYNLGFLGLKRSLLSARFLDWWCERLSDKCIIDLKEGYFTDQIWFNLVPLLFKEVTVVDHPGFNMAYWNLHERVISRNADFFKVNKTEDLFFYHFSSFDTSLDKLMPHKDARFHFNDRNEMLDLYLDYKNDLNKLMVIDYTGIKYYAGHYPLSKQQPSLISRILKKVIRELKSRTA